MSHFAPSPGSRQAALVFAVLATGTALGISGIEMVLPLVPTLPSVLSGTPAQAEFTIAAYIAGGAIGVALFGALGSRFDARRLLALALLTHAGMAFLAVSGLDLGLLAVPRLIQGATGMATTVLAPGLLRRLYPGAAGIRRMGWFGTIGAVVALLSPLLSILLTKYVSWRAVFIVPGLAALVAGMAISVPQRALPATGAVRLFTSLRVIRHPGVLRYGLNQALAPAALLTFAFGAPAVLGGEPIFDLPRFVVLRLCGTLAYVACATVDWRLSRYGSPIRLTVLATALSMLAAIGAVVVLSSHAGFMALILCWVLVNVGQGLREPIAQMSLVGALAEAAPQGIAMTLLVHMLAIAVLTAGIAPFAQTGPLPLAICSASVWMVAFIAILLPDRASRRR